MVSPKDLRDALLRSQKAVPTSRLGRLWRSGRTAAGLGAAAIGARLKGNDELDVSAIARLVTQLGELRGVAMKAGQIMGYVDPSLPDELRVLLSLLQTSAPASPWDAVEGTIRAALGERAPELLAGMERTPIAVASIGQVHRGRLPNGQEVAIKVRHPGIEKALQGDFENARAGSTFAQLLAPGAGGAAAGFVDEARTAILEECDFALEATRQARFAKLFGKDPVILIPAVEPAWCARDVLTSQWLPGESFDAFLAGAPSQAERDRFAEALFRFYVGSLYTHGLFHADPHPGNYGFRKDGRLVIYDFGCVRTFDAPTIAALARIVAAVRADDEAAMAEGLRGLGGEPPTDDAARAQLRALVRGYFAPLLHSGACAIPADAGFEAGQTIRDKRAILRLKLPPRLLFLFRLRFGLYAVLARLGGRVDWAGLESGWAQARLER